METAVRAIAPRPLDAFCCGCSLDLGVKCITLLHLVANLLVLSAIGNDVLGKSTNFAVWYEDNLTLAMLLAGWTLCGVLFSAAGFCGTLLKSEAIVRTYWYYAVCCYVLESTFVIKDLVISGPCQSIPVLLNGMATAVTCGVFRVVNFIVVVFLLILPLYFVFVVFSYCDNVAFGNAGPGFHDLATASDRFYRPWLYKQQAQDEVDEYIMNQKIVGMPNPPGGYGNPNRGGGYGAVYQQAASQGLGGSTTLFGKCFHDMQYPRATNTP